MSRMAKGIKRDLGPCSDPECPARAGAKGWCTRHYGTLWRARLLPWQRKEPVALAAQLAEIRRAETHVPGSNRSADSARHAEDRRASIESELKWARMAYPCAAGATASAGSSASRIWKPRSRSWESTCWR